MNELQNLKDLYRRLESEFYEDPSVQLDKRLFEVKQKIKELEKIKPELKKD